MNRQCEAILDRLLEVTQDGWPRECDVRCGQTVGLGVLRDYSGEPHYFCSRHYQLVDARVSRADAAERSRRDLADAGREAVHAAADRREEMRLIRPGVVR